MSSETNDDSIASTKDLIDAVNKIKINTENFTSNDIAIQCSILRSMHLHNIFPDVADCVWLPGSTLGISVLKKLVLPHTFNATQVSDMESSKLVCLIIFKSSAQSIPNSEQIKDSLVKKLKGNPLSSALDYTFVFGRQQTKQEEDGLDLLE
jgi:lipid-binding SYLF domain-containing protein